MLAEAPEHQAALVDLAALDLDEAEFAEAPGPGGRGQDTAAAEASLDPFDARFEQRAADTLAALFRSDGREIEQTRPGRPVGRLDAGDDAALPHGFCQL